MVRTELTKGISRLFRIGRAVAIATYKEWSAYRSHALLSLITAPAFFLVQSCIWKSVLATKGSIRGMDLPQMLSYYGVITLMNTLIFDFADWNLSMLIRTGQFNSFMLRPLSHRFYAFSQKIGHRCFGFFIEFLPLLAVFIFIFHVNLKPKEPLWFAISVALSFCLIFLTNYCMGMLSFWFTRIAGIRRLFMLFAEISAGVLMPLVFFPKLVQQIFFFLPFQFMTFVPLRVFAGRYELAGHSLTIPQVVACQGAVVLIMFILSELIWRRAIRHYSGVGA